MQTFALTCLANLLALAAAAQGTVTFQNAHTLNGWDPVVDRNVRFGIGASSANIPQGANVSSNYAGLNLSSLRAALYYAPGNVSDANWQMVNLPATGGAATFKQSTSATAGSWFGGTRTLDGIPAQGGVASLMVVVWDSSLSADPLSAAAQATITWGRSAVFSYTTPTSDTPAPADYLMNNLRSFEIATVPEPTPWSLLGFGATLLILFRRHNQW
jgi:hypothetical protein